MQLAPTVTNQLTDHLGWQALPGTTISTGIDTDRTQTSGLSAHEPLINSVLAGTIGIEGLGQEHRQSVCGRVNALPVFWQQGFNFLEHAFVCQSIEEQVGIGLRLYSAKRLLLPCSMASTTVSHGWYSVAMRWLLEPKA